MKYYFIVNPTSGKKEGVEYIKTQIDELTEELKKNNEFILRQTEYASHATKIVKEIVTNETEEHIIFACGGDGTCFEVLNGLVGYSHVKMGIIPVGSCNDFLKFFPEYNFLSLKKQILGTEKLIDIIKVNNEYCLNVANFGFDARVNHDQIKFRSKHKTVKAAYNHALAKNVLSKIGDEVIIKSNNEVLFNGKSFLFTVANASFYGGGYKCAPIAKVDDGLFDFTVVKKISILKFLRLVKNYKLGNHLNIPKYQKVLKFKQLENIVVDSVNELVGCIDGETRISKHFDINIIKKAVKFNLPQQ